jgi:hypothetical protein
MHSVVIALKECAVLPMILEANAKEHHVLDKVFVKFWIGHDVDVLMGPSDEIISH